MGEKREIDRRLMRVMNWANLVNDSLYKYNTDKFCNIQDSKTDLRQYAKF